MTAPAPQTTPLPTFDFSSSQQQMSNDDLQRQSVLQAAADQYAHEQKLTALARRNWQDQQERSHLNLMAQLPKLIGAVMAGVALAYVIPLGADR